MHTAPGGPTSPTAYLGFTPPRNTPRLAGKIAALIAVCLVLCAAALTTPARAQDGTKLAFYTGHMDIFNVIARDGGLEMSIKEDVTGHGVLRSPEKSVLVVNKEAWSDQVVSYGVPASYTLPQSQDPKLLWPGWDTLQASPEFQSVRIVFDEVTGPGEVHIFQQGAFGGSQPLLEDGSTHLRSGSARLQAEPAHTHAYWTFAAAGTYTMKVHAESNGVKTDTHTYTWEVAPDGEVPNTIKAEPGVQLDEAGSGGSTSNGGGYKGNTEDFPILKSGRGPYQSQWLKSVLPGMFADQAPADQAPGQGAQQATAGDNGKASAASSPDNGTAHGIDKDSNAECRWVPGAKNSSGLGLVPLIRDDRQSPPAWRSPDNLPFHLSEKSTATTTEQIGSIAAGTKVWMIGATQVHGVPWVGANTMNPSVMEKSTGEVTWSLTGFEGPGAMEVFTSGNFGKVVGDTWFGGSGTSASGAITIPRNTHVHPNWVFSAPGVYHLTITQTATLKDGTKVSAPARLTFNVGTGTGAEDGHFDLGAEIKAGAASGGSYQDAAGNPCTPGAADTAGSNAAGEGAVTPVSAGGAIGAADAGGQGRLASTGQSILLVPIAFLAVALAVLGASFLRYSRVSQRIHD